MIIRNIICDFKLQNKNWGYLSILGEIKKLKIKVCKTTIKNILKNEFPEYLSRKKKWDNYIHNHFSKDLNKIIACDFKKINTNNGLLFTLIFESIKTREVLHVNSTQHPTRKWIEQQLKELTDGSTKKQIIIDNDELFKYIDFAKFNMDVQCIRPRMPERNAYIERLIGTLNRTVLNKYNLREITLDKLNKILIDFVLYYNNFRPHQGIGNITIPEYKRFLLDKNYNPHIWSDHFLFCKIQKQSLLEDQLNHYFYVNFKAS